MVRVRVRTWMVAVGCSCVLARLHATWNAGECRLGAAAWRTALFSCRLGCVSGGLSVSTTCICHHLRCICGACELVDKQAPASTDARAWLTLSTMGLILHTLALPIRIQAERITIVESLMLAAARYVPLAAPPGTSPRGHSGRWSPRQTAWWQATISSHRCTRPYTKL